MWTTAGYWNAWSKNKELNISSELGNVNEGHHEADGGEDEQHGGEHEAQVRVTHQHEHGQV